MSNIRVNADYKKKFFLCSHWSGFLALTFKLFLYHIKLIHAALQLHQTNHGSGEYHKHLCVRWERMIFSAHVANWWNIHTVLTLSPTLRRKKSNLHEKGILEKGSSFTPRENIMHWFSLTKLFILQEKKNKPTTEKYPKYLYE